MLQNAYFLAKIGADTAENEQYFAEILPKTGNYPTGPNVRRARRCLEPGLHVLAAQAFAVFVFLLVCRGASLSLDSGNHRERQP